MVRYTLALNDFSEIHVFKCEQLSEEVCRCEEVSLCGNLEREKAKEEITCLPLEEARVEMAQLTNRGDKPCRECLLKLFGL